MSEFSVLLGLLDKEDEKSFRNYLVSRNKRHDSKIQDLYEACLKGREKGLKNSMTTNAFNSMKSRLKSSLIEFLKSQSLDIEKPIYGLLNIGKRISQSGNTDYALKYFKEAEELSRQSGDIDSQFKALDLILENAEDLSEEEFHSLKERYFKIHEKLVAEQKLHVFYASVNREFKRAEYLGETVDVTGLIEKELKLLFENRITNLDFRSLYKVLEILDVYGSYSKKYYAIGGFFEESIKECEVELVKDAAVSIHQLNVYALISNIFFRKREFEKSVYYCEQLQYYLTKYDGQEKDRLIRVQKDLQVLNLHLLGKTTEALKVMEAHEIESEESEEFTLSSKLIKAMVLFHQEKFEDIPRIISRFYQSDVFYERIHGREKILYKHFIEILVYVELGDYDFAESKINSVKRKYRDDFKDFRYSSALPFLNLVKSTMDRPEIIQEDQFRKKVKNAIDWKPFEEEDLFFMCFYAWIKAKLNSAGVYETTLEIVRSDK